MLTIGEFNRDSFFLTVDPTTSVDSSPTFDMPRAARRPPKMAAASRTSRRRWRAACAQLPPLVVARRRPSSAVVARLHSPPLAGRRDAASRAVSPRRFFLARVAVSRCRRPLAALSTRPTTADELATTLDDERDGFWRRLVWRRRRRRCRCRCLLCFACSASFAPTRRRFLVRFRVAFVYAAPRRPVDHRYLTREVSMRWSRASWGVLDR